MLKAAVTMAFFGMLRVSEYTCRDAHHYDVDTTLLRRDVYVMRDMALVHLKSSKTDPFRTGVTIRIAATRRSSCPGQWLQAYLGVCMDSQRPLFAFQDGRFLTRRDLVGILQEPRLNTHSLRAVGRGGGGTTLANMGVPDYVIQILGRWRSDAYQRFVHFSGAYIARLHVVMATPRAASYLRGVRIQACVAKVTKQLEVGKRNKVRSRGQRVHFLIESHPVKVELKKNSFIRDTGGVLVLQTLPPNNKGADEAQHDRR